MPETASSNADYLQRHLGNLKIYRKQHELYRTWDGADYTYELRQDGITFRLDRILRPGGHVRWFMESKALPYPTSKLLTGMDISASDDFAWPEVEHAAPFIYKAGKLCKS